MNLFYLCLWSIFTIVLGAYVYLIISKNKEYNLQIVEKWLGAMIIIAAIISLEVKTVTVSSLSAVETISYFLTVASLLYPLKLIIPDALEDLSEKRTLSGLLKMGCSVNIGWITVYLFQVALGEIVIKIWS